MIVLVGAVTEHEFHVVFHEREGCVHLLVG